MTVSQKIVVIEDEVKIAQMIKDYLEREGFSVFMAENGTKGIERVRQKSPDLIILDLMLPDMSGLEVCRTLNRENNTPIIMLTAKSQETDRIVGLEMGADDYITKPFSLAELTARIRAVLRRAGGNDQQKFSQEKIIDRGELKIDIEKHKVRKSNEEIVLTPTEFNILALMAHNPGRVFSRLQLLDAALGETYSGYERSIDTHISNLRRKIEDDPASPSYVVTVFGLGYKFNE
ncbi:MAG: response regulator transcription factor [Bacillota bacterium]|nr:response regulator transcription factor [Bacillota bacterium]